MAAQPDIEKRVEQMVSNHRWMPPGYKVWSSFRMARLCGRLLIPVTGEIWRLVRHVSGEAQDLLYQSRALYTVPFVV